MVTKVPKSQVPHRIYSEPKLTMDSTRRKKNILEHLKGGELEIAMKNIAEFQVRLKLSDFDRIISFLEEELKQSVSKEQIRSAKRLKRIINSIRSLRRHGPDPANILEPAILPDCYNGKILLVSVTGGIIENTTILRSGDLWHNEILRDTQEEIKDLGLVSSEVYPLGGARARVEKDRSIVIWGTSDQFGACDKEAAARLIKILHPDKKIEIE